MELELSPLEARRTFVSMNSIEHAVESSRVLSLITW
jgi:hypothetical protein